MRKLTLLSFFSTALTALVASADQPGPPPGGPPHRPPEEAFAACTCVKVPEHIQEDAGKLFCAPPHQPPRAR